MAVTFKVRQSVSKKIQHAGMASPKVIMSSSFSNTSETNIKCTGIEELSDNLQPSDEESSIWILPEEVLIYLCQHLHVKDLLNLAAAHQFFHDLISSTSSIWTATSFFDTWPSASTLKHFDRAADLGNIEALVKLGIAYLYNEGLPGDFQGSEITTNSKHASEKLCRVECLTSNVAPFIWLFIRPPWSHFGACCKQFVFSNMVDYCRKTNDKKVLICVAKTIQLLDDPTLNREPAQYLERAANSGSTHAAYLMWKHKYQGEKLEPGSEMASVRELRDIALSARGTSHGALNSANQMNTELMLELCHLYASQQYGGLSQDLAHQFVREVVSNSSPMHINEIYKRKNISHAMRFILVDWLVEVAGMKDFSSYTLHAAICMVDRYLKIHVITRSKLQLLGVAAMVLCSRFLGHDIITIREAAWLTDNTYRYEDVVRMMGEITAALKGSMKVTTVLDFLYLFINATPVDRRTQCLAEYLSELSLLQSDLGEYTRAQLAASCLLLARIQSVHDMSATSRATMDTSTVWDGHMESFTGFSQKCLSMPTLHIYEKCFDESNMVDHREVVLQAVKTRFSDDKFGQISSIKMLSGDSLRSVLGIESMSFNSSTLVPPTDDGLIMSPSRSKHRKQLLQNSMDLDSVLSAREQAATPFPQQAATPFPQEAATPFLQEAATTEDHGFIDLEQMWCNDNTSENSYNDNQRTNSAKRKIDNTTASTCSSVKCDEAGVLSICSTSHPSKQQRRDLLCNVQNVLTVTNNSGSDCVDGNNNSDVNNNGDGICSPQTYAGSTPRGSVPCVSPADSGIDLSMFSENDSPADLTSGCQSFKQSDRKSNSRGRLSRSRSFTLSPRITPVSPGSSTPISVSPCVGSPSSIILSPLASPILYQPTNSASASPDTGSYSSRRRCMMQSDSNSRSTLSPNLCVKRLKRSIQDDRDKFNSMTRNSSSVTVTSKSYEHLNKHKNQ